ncbi:GyrI-like domain-containing protein [Aeromonas sp. BIGb0445]|uniref:GyrI-like domain-containing protein n=1 Tax=Aeromonas sp. BIGb0445 TaxID=2940593 RepID=UPI002166ED35|nr:GyrI-like domain-containing protein [Aeromonas sp. BIGb0445]MCS3458511.1 putative transcriptional regulator YdeE [Aeromonas sp. BIGb0445]
MSQPQRFEQGRPMLLGGLRRQHDAASADIGRQWRDAGQLWPLPGQLGEYAYGVMCGGDDSRFEYMCALEVACLAALPAGLGRMRIEAQTYAVFCHQGHVSTLPARWQEALAWLAASQYQSAHKPDFERYSPQFDGINGIGEMEIWLAVVPRQQLA